MKAARQEAPPGHRYSTGCPHCAHAARVRSSRELSPLLRQLYFACTNVECGHTFGAFIEIAYTISPSACPNPEIHLPLAPPRSRRPVNDNPIEASGGPEVPPSVIGTQAIAGARAQVAAGDSATRAFPPAA